jgi:predicted MFS family arabinose efflux permease
VTGDIATISWRAAFVVLAVPALALAWFVFKLPEPPRGATEPLQSVHPSPGRARDEEEGKPSDAQQLAREHGIEPDPDLVLRREKVGFAAAVSHVLRVRTNLVLIAASACGYYFLAGIQTFGSEFAKEQYRINQAFANVLLLLVGVGAVVGVLAGGFLGDWLVRRRYLKGRILISVIAATGATVLFVPALFVRTAFGALPYLALAALALSAQNPPLDAARLDIMPAQLWGRAEAIRTVLRGLAQALAPLLFGLVSDYVFGGGRVGLQRTFVVMLLPLAASAALLYRALDTYPRDVASAAASANAADEWSWDESTRRT